MSAISLDPDSLFRSTLGEARGIVVAVSGGPDSVALLHLLASWPEHPNLYVATVDHGLRPESAAEAAMVARLAADLGLPHATLLWQGKKPETGIQVSARVARYGLLLDHARAVSATHMVTAHHADDQAETVLMRLFAGSGPEGLVGMRPVMDRDGIMHVRPFLDIPRSALRAYCDWERLSYVDDPSNAYLRFGRPRLRRLMTQLVAEGLTTERVIRLARRLAEVKEALDHAARRAASLSDARAMDGVVSMNWAALIDEPIAVRKTILERMIERATGNGFVQLLKLERLEADLTSAAALGKPLRRTLAGRLLSLRPSGHLRIQEAPPRRRLS